MNILSFFLIIYIAIASSICVGQVPAEYYDGSTVDMQDRIEHFKLGIAQAESANGPYSPDLGEILFGLGHVYQEFNEYEKAIEVYNRALHLMRLNDGLYSEEQIPVVAALIESHMALGNMVAADDKQDYIFRIKTGIYVPGSNEYNDAVLNYTQWQRIAYKYKVGEQTYNRLLRIELLFQDIGQTDVDFVYRQFFNRYIISSYSGEPVPEIQISIGLGGTAGNSSDPSLEYAIFKRIKKSNYIGGLNILKDLMIAETDPMVKAKLLSMLGDWHTWYGHPGASKYYLQAYEIDPSLFEIPVKLPPQEAITVDEYRVVKATVIFSAQVNKSGELRNIEAIHFDTESDRFIAKKQIKKWRYRPRIVDGKFVDTENVIVEHVTDKK